MRIRSSYCDQYVRAGGATKRVAGRASTAHGVRSLCLSVVIWERSSLHDCALCSTPNSIRQACRWGMNHGIAERQKQFKTFALSLAEGSGKGGAQASRVVIM